MYTFQIIPSLQRKNKPLQREKNHSQKQQHGLGHYMERVPHGLGGFPGKSPFKVQGGPQRDLAFLLLKPRLWAIRGVQTLMSAAPKATEGVRQKTDPMGKVQ